MNRCFGIVTGICICLTGCQERPPAEAKESAALASSAIEIMEKTNILEILTNEDENQKEMLAVNSVINPNGQVLKDRFLLPAGFERAASEEGTFAYYLQMLPLKPDGSKVLIYDGREKTKDVYLAVVDFPLGDRDLQQCADAVMRLRAEYLYSIGEWNQIHFNFVSGFRADFSKWAQGYGISVKNDQVTWVQNSSKNSSYESFQQYLNIVYAYASTLSLEQELVPRDIADLSIGDVFIKGGSPGHCVIVVDMAVNETTGETLFMLAQSYMPAQDIQILKGEANDSPWYHTDFGNELRTPEWTFDSEQLRTWVAETR